MPVYMFKNDIYKKIKITVLVIDRCFPVFLSVL